MSRERFQSTGKTSFYGDYLYDRAVPRGDFLRKMKEVVPWDRFTHAAAKRGLGGPPTILPCC